MDYYYRQLRKDKKKAILHPDKLFTDDRVLTCDLQQQVIVRLETPSFLWQQAVTDTQKSGPSLS